MKTKKANFEKIIADRFLTKLPIAHADCKVGTTNEAKLNHEERREKLQKKIEKETKALKKAKSKNKFREIADFDAMGQGGLYCITPFSGTDEHGQGIFKVGYAFDLKHRLDNYHTCFPMGVLVKHYIIIHSKAKEKNPDAKSKQLEIVLRLVESFLIKHLTLTSTRMFQTTRKMNKGFTEWFFASEKDITRAFEKAYNIMVKKKYDVDLTAFPSSSDEEGEDLAISSYLKSIKLKNKDKDLLFTGEIQYTAPPHSPPTPTRITPTRKKKKSSPTTLPEAKTIFHSDSEDET